MELLDEWGVPDDRVPDHAKLLATVGITMQGLAQANMADLAAVLAGGKEQATPIHDFDATTIIKGAAAVVAGEFDNNVRIARHRLRRGLHGCGSREGGWLDEDRGAGAGVGQGWAQTEVHLRE